MTSSVSEKEFLFGHIPENLPHFSNIVEDTFSSILLKILDLHDLGEVRWTQESSRGRATVFTACVDMMNPAHERAKIPMKFIATSISGNNEAFILISDTGLMRTQKDFVVRELYRRLLGQEFTHKI